MSPRKTTSVTWPGYIGLLCLSLAGAGCSDATPAPGSGASGTAGSSGAAGSSGGPTATPDASSTEVSLSSFQTDLEGFVFNEYQTGTDEAGAPIDPNNLSKRAVLTWDAGQGNPKPGSMKIEIPFSAYDQKADFHRVLATSLDLTNKALSVWIKLESGFSVHPSAPGGFVLYLKTGSMYAYGQATWKNLDGANHSWIQLLFDPTNGVDAMSPPAPGFDPAAVVEVGFYIHTGGAGGMPDAFPAPTAAVFYVDSFAIRPLQ